MARPCSPGVPLPEQGGREVRRPLPWAVQVRERGSAVLIAGRLPGRNKVVFLLQRRLLQSNCPQTISGVGEIRIRFLIIFPVKAALDPMDEGEGLFHGGAALGLGWNRGS